MTGSSTSAMDLCEIAWGSREGYVCLSLRDPSVDKHGKGYWQDLTFTWPNDRTRIAEALDRARTSRKDVYWSPAVFSRPTRTKEAISEVSTLWADLDDADPHKFPRHLRPTAVWETSPNRWQALWLLDRSLKPDVQTKLNQRLTYAVGADKGGWDLTQVLRIPNTPNHKYPDNPKVKLLYLNGHTLDPLQLLADLPDLKTAEIDEAQIDEVPEQAAVLRRYKDKITARVKELVRARHATVGTRSDRLWELECLLAEAGMSPAEIVGVCQPTVWNKFNGRHDEFVRLSTEARKAIEHVGRVQEKVEQDTLEEVEDVVPVTWSTFDREHVAVRWLVADVWGESEVGFISGHPKSYKSWLALDLAVSVATGTRFLGSFQTRKHNVLLIQEEDPRPVIQERLAMIGEAKGLIDAKVKGDAVDFLYALPDNLYIISNQGFTINEEWLELLEAWIIERDIKLVILDPLMMMGGDFDEFKAFEVMGKVLKPLKLLRARTQVAVAVVHHHTKGASQGGAKDMYGSVALWAWEESALHLQVTGVGQLVAERFSKHALLPPLTVELGDIKDLWRPAVAKLGSSNLYDVLVTMEGGATVEELMKYTGLNRDVVSRQLKQLGEQGKVERGGTRRSSAGRPSIVWRMK